MRRFIVLSALVLIMGLSLLAIQCAPGNGSPFKAPLKGLAPGATEQLKMPLQGFCRVGP